MHLCQVLRVAIFSCSVDALNGTTHTQKFARERARERARASEWVADFNYSNDSVVAGWCTASPRPQSRKRKAFPVQFREFPTRTSRKINTINVPRIQKQRFEPHDCITPSVDSNPLYTKESILKTDRTTSRQRSVEEPNQYLWHKMFYIGMEILRIHL